MARIKRAVNAVKKRRKVFKLSKGYYGAKSKLYRAASQQVMKSMAYAYVGRKLKKGSTASFGSLVSMRAQGSAEPTIPTSSTASRLPVLM